MKSKKIVALALTAAMAISMASMTAFAKTEYVDGHKDVDIEALYATITVSKDDYEKEKAKTDSVIGTDNTVLIKDLYGDLFGLEKNYTDCNTATKTFLGWNNTTTKKGAVATDKPDDTTLKVTFALDETGKNYVATVDAAYSVTTKDEDIAKNLKAIEDAKKDKEATKSRDEKLKEGDEANAATNNVKDGDNGAVTKAAPVSEPVAIENAAKTDRNVHDFKVVNKDFGDSTLAWVYYVNEEDKVTLISGKNARVTLKAPKGYNPTDYKVAVYHIKGYCSAEKVKGLDIAKTDVTFWANDFSPYVLVLTPKDAVAGTSTGNPSTGDFSAVPVAMLAAAALGATGFVAYKKRKAE